MEAFVTGSTGFVGRALIDALLKNRWQVRALSRRRSRAARLPQAVQVIDGDMGDDAALRRGVAGADVVFHLAAATSGPWKQHAEVTVEGTRRIIRLCDEAGVRRLLLVSSIVVYDKRGQSADVYFRETAPLLPPEPFVGAYARGKVEAENLARQYAQRPAQKTEIVIVRPGLIYSRERLAFPHLGELVGQLRIAFGRPSLLLPLVELESCVDALLRLGTATAAPGKIYNVVDNCYPTRRDWLQALESLTGYRQRVIYLPVWPLATAAKGITTISRITGLRPASDVSAEKFRSRATEVRYDTRELQRDTGWKPLQVLEQGLVRTGIAASRGRAQKIRRVGIVGAGMIARLHVAALQSIPQVRLVGICDSSMSAARGLAAMAGDVPAFDDSSQFYKEAEPELVHVLTPPQTHGVVAGAALRHDAHVLLEKPATTSLKDCDALLAAADAAKLTAGVDETVAWDPLVRRARGAIIHGVLGDLLHVGIVMGFDLSRGGRLALLMRDAAAWEHQLTGGPLEDLLPHPLAVVRALCGPLEARHWYSRSSGRLPCDFPDELRLSLGTGDVTAQVDLSLNTKPDDFLLTVLGTRATLRIDVNNMLFDCLSPLPGPRAVARGVRTLRSAGRILGQTCRNGIAVAGRRALPPASPAHLIRAHYAALARGEAPPAPLSAARFDIAIARAIWPQRTDVERAADPVVTPLSVRAGTTKLQYER